MTSFIVLAAFQKLQNSISTLLIFKLCLDTIFCGRKGLKTEYQVILYEPIILSKAILQYSTI